MNKNEKIDEVVWLLRNPENFQTEEEIEKSITFLESLKTKTKVVVAKEYGVNVSATYEIVLSQFPVHLHPKDPSTWMDCLEKLERIDKIPLGAVIEIVKWVRKDDFWKTNFLSLVKLRKTNKEGIKYIVVFNEKMINEKSRTNSKQGVSNEKLADILSAEFDEEQ